MEGLYLAVNCIYFSPILVNLSCRAKFLLRECGLSLDHSPGLVYSRNVDSFLFHFVTVDARDYMNVQFQAFCRGGDFQP